MYWRDQQSRYYVFHIVGTSGPRNYRDVMTARFVFIFIKKKKQKLDLEGWAYPHP
jgi:hypothetical protein